MTTLYQIINRISRERTLYGAKTNYFTLIHTHDRYFKVHLKTKMDKGVLEMLTAYLQFECSSIDEVFGLSEDQMTEILCKYYDCERLVACDDTEKIDVHRAWEMWCSQAEKVQSIPAFKREGIHKELKKYVSEYLFEQEGSTRFFE